MRVVNIHGINDVRLDPAAAVQPGTTDILVKIEACGVCGTDLTFIKGGGAGPHAPVPMPLGHEAAGEVVSVGAAVADIEVGQRVVINPMGNLTNIIGNGGTEGAFTERLLVRDAQIGRNVLQIPDNVSYEMAALTEPLGVAMHGVNRSAAKPGDKVVVFGVGPIGLAAVMWLADRGVKDIVAVDMFPERLERATALGASAVICAATENLRDRLKELHGTQSLLNREVIATDIYIDAAGAPTIVPDVVAMARQHARLIVIAAYRAPVALDLQMMLASEMTITTSIGYPIELEQVLAALPRLSDKLEHLVSHHYPLDDVIEALKVAGGPNVAKVMIHMDGGTQR